MVKKLNTDYKPLTVAVFLVVGGLLLGFLFIPKAGVIKSQVSLGATSFIPKAQGAEIDSAALTVQDAPFLASANTGDSQAGVTSSSQNPETFYSDGAMKDPGVR